MEETQEEVLSPDAWFKKEYPIEICKDKYNCAEQPEFTWPNWDDDDILEYSEYRHKEMLKQSIPSEEEICDLFFDFSLDRLEDETYVMKIEQFKAAIELLTKGGK